ncbi:MAG: transcriptional regulator [Bacteroidaceae bacterium]|nr:transcriptional regulator [Bacteroidaceae bacterium]
MEIYTLTMLYALAHFLRDKTPWIWTILDVVNSALFALRYDRKLNALETRIMAKYSENTGYKVCRMRDVSASQLVDFFRNQPKEAFKYFKPHGFDEKSILSLQQNKSFLAYVLLDNDRIAGYCFNRSFFHGKGFRGRMTGINHRGRGLGTLMNKLLNEIGFGIGLQLFETVSKDNVASYRSAVSAGKFKVVKELPNNELFLQIIQ